MAEGNGSTVLAPVQPVVFLAIGRSAVGTLAQLRREAQDLHVRISGPFGVVAVPDTAGTLSNGGVFIGDCQWVADIELSNPAGGESKGPRLNDTDETIVRELTRLVRQLRPDRPTVGRDASPRIRAAGYILIDLADPMTVEVALRLARLLRVADPTLDLTALALTGRTADSGTEPDAPWLDASMQLVRKAQEQLLLHRLYFLDGRDTNNTWLRTKEQMERLGAQFLLHHGLSPYRAHLRRNELSRLSRADDFLHACGSFCCRTLRTDYTTVARILASKLASEDLADLEHGVLTKERSDAIDDQAKKLADSVRDICQDEGGVDTNSHAPNESPPGPPTIRNKKLTDALEQAVACVCTGNPVASLRWFLMSLRPRLGQLSASSALMDRALARCRAAQIVGRQTKATYAPTQFWLGVSGARWPGRYAPILDDPQSVRISQPGHIAFYWGGILFLVLGSVGVIAGALEPNNLYALFGGMLVIGSSAVTALGCRWSWVEVRPADVNDEVAGHAGPTVVGRRRTPRWALLTVAAFLGTGLLCVGWSLSIPDWFRGWTTDPNSLVILWTSAVLMALAGFALQVWPANETWRFETRRSPGIVTWTSLGSSSERASASDWQGPPNWVWRIVGLAFLAGAWLIVSGRVPNATYLVGLWQWGGCLAGLVLILVGAGLAQWPWRMSGHLAYWTFPKPKPLASGFAHTPRGPELMQQASALAQWVDRLLTESQSRDVDQLEWPGRQPAGTVLDVLVPEWEQRLADILRADLRSGREQSLMQLAGNPQRWAKCLVADFTSPARDPVEPRFRFALQIVEEWLEKWSWESLIARLRPDPQCFDVFVTRNVSPQWPIPRTNPHVDSTVIVVGHRVWDLVAPLARSENSRRFVRLDWQDPETLVVIRIVQGLVGGWHGMDPLPRAGRDIERDQAVTNREIYDAVAADIHQFCAMLRHFLDICEDAIRQEVREPEQVFHNTKCLIESRGSIEELMHSMSPSAPEGANKAADGCVNAFQVLMNRIHQITPELPQAVLARLAKIEVPPKRGRYVNRLSPFWADLEREPTSK